MSYEVTLESLKGGAAVEMVNNALEEVWANVLDPNTNATAKRSVVMKIEFKPAQDRASSPVSIAVEKKLASQAAVSAHVNIGTDSDGIATASEYMNPNQNELPITSEGLDIAIDEFNAKNKGECVASRAVSANVTPFKAAANAN